jgi:DNA-binding transcriptional LysR family regulator
MTRPAVPILVELRDLKWAIVASQHRSLRRAAEVLNIRQSTLSRHLRDMEQRVGAQLFHRANGGTSTTMPGREFLESARHILQETDAALHRLQTRSRGENGRLTIGVYASLSTGNMFATLSDHRRCFPEVEVQIVDGGHDDLICGLSSKAIDIAIMTNSAPNWDDRTLPLWCERAILAVHKRHPFAEMPVVPLVRPDK